MSNSEHCPNEFSQNNHLQTNGPTNPLGRSVSSARFQIARVSPPETHHEASLNKAISIPAGKSILFSI